MQCHPCDISYFEIYNIALADSFHKKTCMTESRGQIDNSQWTHDNSVMLCNSVREF